MPNMAKAIAYTDYSDEIDDTVMEWEVYFLSRRLEASNTFPIAQVAHHWMLLLESEWGVVCIEADKSSRAMGFLAPRISYEVPKYEKKKHIDTVKRTYNQIFTCYKKNKLNNTIYNYLANNCQNWVNEFCKMAGIKSPECTTATKVAVGVGLGALAVGLLAYAFSPSKPSNEKSASHQ